MPRGCHNKKAPLSTARRQAERKPHAKAKPKAKPKTIIDDRPSQRLPPKPLKAPEWAKLAKGEHESIPGTRVQCGKGGIAVRVVIEDGKSFPPHKVQAVKKHLRKLEQQAVLKREVDRIHATDGPIDPASLLSSQGPVVKARPVPKVTITVPQNKKERKQQQYQAFKQRQAELHASKAKEAGRELVSHEWHAAEVVLRSEGRAWVQLADCNDISESVVTKMDEIARIASVTPTHEGGHILAVSFADIADKELQLTLGTKLKVKVFRDRQGVGGCEAVCLDHVASLEAACPEKEPQLQQTSVATVEEQVQPAKKRRIDPGSLDELGAVCAPDATACPEGKPDGSL